MFGLFQECEKNFLEQQQQHSQLKRPRHGGLREVLPQVERLRDEHQRCLQRAQRREGLLRCNARL